jgi:hypothetical protein
LKRLQAASKNVKIRQETSNFVKKKGKATVQEPLYLCLIEQQHPFCIFVQFVLGCFLFLGFDVLAGCV